MPNSPIQIVLNTDNFIVSRDKFGGGAHMDFYADNDAEFKEHKNNILAQLNTIKNNQVENRYSEISFAKLTLKSRAIAKTRRPTHAIFKRNITPIVGAGDLGELFVELRPSSIDEVSVKIKEAEEETIWKTQDGKRKPDPSRLRSELGAIKEISPYTAADKRKFSISDGLAWISDPRTGGAYIVELFETPPPRQEWDNLPDEKFKLYRSFVDGFLSFEQGLFAFRLVGSDERAIMMGVRLEESAEPSIVQLMPTQSSARRPSTVINVNQDKSEHAKLLKFLDSHPLVKKILLPPIITQSRTQASRQIGDRYSVPAVEHNEYPIIGIVDSGVSSLMSDWIEEQWRFLSDKDKDEAHGTFIAGLALSSATLNGREVYKELDGCKIVDLDLLPKEEKFRDYYKDGVPGFLEELEIAVRELKARTSLGVRTVDIKEAARVMPRV